MSSVDVVIPCYKYGRFLRGCVDSVLSQAGVDVRVLVIDDCSPDETPQVGAALAAEDSRVEFRRHAVNRGHIATYNEGLLEWAKADYCMLLSADDFVARGSFLRAVRVLDGHPDVSLVYGRWLTVDSDEVSPTLPPDECVDPDVKIVPGSDFLRTACAMAHNPIACPAAVIVRTDVQHRIGGYLPELPHTGDLEMWMRFAAGRSIAELSSVQGVYRKHNSNMSWGYSKRPLRDLQQRLAAFDMFFDAWGSQVAETAALRQLVTGAISTDAVWAAYGAFDRGEIDYCRECLEFAAEVRPQVRATPVYRKLRLKRSLGYPLWSVVRPVIRYLRKGSRDQSPATDEAGPGDQVVAPPALTQ